MQNFLTFNISLDPKKSLVENLERELADCDVMIDVFKFASKDKKHYEDMKEYLEKLIKELKNDR